MNDRHKADWILENRAWERVKSPNAKFGERAAAWFVTTAMKTKRKLGLGHSKSLTMKKYGARQRTRRKVHQLNSTSGTIMRKYGSGRLNSSSASATLMGKYGAGRRRTRIRRRKGVRKCTKQRRRINPSQSFHNAIIKKITSGTSVGKGLKENLLMNSRNIRKATLLALKLARAAVRKAGGKKRIHLPRIIPLPSNNKKVGGFLPLLLPILAGRYRNWENMYLFSIFPKLYLKCSF